MAQSMTGILRSDILRHVCGIYFPEDFYDAIWNTLPQIWEDYLTTTVGPLPPGSSVPNVSIYIESQDSKIKRFISNTWKYKMFTGRMALFPFCTIGEYSTETLTLDLDSCPIQQLRDTVSALADMYAEMCDFEVALNSELLKSPSVENFLKKFPETKGALAPWIKDMVVDLPVVCEINMDEIGFEAV